jgi:LysM repeat protein
MRYLFLSIGFFIANQSFSNESVITQSEYIENWKATAINEMISFNIPASITLAQGILESGNGNSELARKGNNHFGIKCHGWEGKTMRLDDDKKDECFRVYKNADDSFEDHSEFLVKYDRYNFLFNYEITNYKAWAKGLKEAGYATNPKYPQLLIDIIEKNGLDKLDNLSSPSLVATPSIVSETKSSKINSNNHSVYLHSNKVKFVIAKKGDTFYKISKEFGLNLSQLYRYNDYDVNKDVLMEGDVIYIQPKRRRSLFKKNEIVLEKSMTIEEIAQFSAVNEKSIRRLNSFTSETTIVSKGELVTLR